MFQKANPALDKDSHESFKFPPSKLVTTHISTMNNSHAIFNEYDIIHPYEKVSISTLPIMEDNTLSLIYDSFLEIDSSQLGSATKMLAMELTDCEQSLYIQIPVQTQSTQSTLNTQNTIPSLVSNNITSKTPCSIVAPENYNKNNEILKSLEEKNKIPLKQEKTFKRLTFSKKNNFLIPKSNNLKTNYFDKNDKKTNDEDNHEIKKKKNTLQMKRKTETELSSKINRKLNFIPQETQETRSTAKSLEEIPNILIETRLTKNINDKKRSRSPLEPLFLDEEIFIDPARAEKYLKNLNAEKQ